MASLNVVNNYYILIGVCDRDFEIGISHKFTITSDKIASIYFDTVKKYIYSNNNNDNKHMFVAPDRTCRIFYRGKPKQQIGYIFIYGDLLIHEQKTLKEAHLLGEKNVYLRN